MSHRPLVYVSGLTVCDYLLWEWSLSGNHEVIAVVAGLSLPFLMLVTLWRLALAGGRLLSDLRRPRDAQAPLARRSRGAIRAAERRMAGSAAIGEAPVSSAQAEPPRKIAA